MEDEIAIKGTISKISDVFFFTASITLLPNLKAECHSQDEARGAPLFQEIISLPWVQEVAAEGRALVVKKKAGSGEWETLAPEVSAIIRKFHKEKKPFFTDTFLQFIKHKLASETIKRPVPYKINEENISTPLGKSIQKILQERISPSLAQHGGYAAMVDLLEGKVYIYFGGGCQGCSQASVTVKEGIERLLLEEFQELTAVVDVTNHADGKNPYFK